MSQDLVDFELKPGLATSLGPLKNSTLSHYRDLVLEAVMRAPDIAAEEQQATRSDHLVPGPADAPPVLALVYAPMHRTAGLPAILQIHGGGFVTGTAAMSDAANRIAAVQLNCVIVAVDYRLAPETTYPGPLEDCYAAYLWLLAASETLGVDPNRVLVEGRSAGSALAAGLCLLARDRGARMPFFQVLSEPMLDHRSSESDHPHAGEFIWTREHNRFGWAAMLGASAAHGVSPYASPALMADLSRLPPTFIQVGALDLFLEESLDYARRLTRAGVSVELHVWPGAYHTFQRADAHISREARRAATIAIRRALHQS